MACPVNAVDITASARMPGARKSMRSPGPVSTTWTVANSTSRSVGMITVSSNCSPLRSSIRVSRAACASTMRPGLAPPGAGVWRPGGSL